MDIKFLLNDIIKKIYLELRRLFLVKGSNNKIVKSIKLFKEKIIIVHGHLEKEICFLTYE